MKQAMIFAAGLGTRLKPLTDTMPKALVPVGGKPLLDIVIDRLMVQGYQRFVVNVHHFAQQIIEHVNASDYAYFVHFSDESDQLLETGGGLKKAAPLFADDSPVLIHNVDILDNVDYQWFSRQHQADEDAVLLVSRHKTKRYLLFNNAMRLMGWTNIETGEIRSPFPWLREAEIDIDENLRVTVRSSIHNSQLSILNSQSSILNSQSSILNSQFPILNSQSSILNSQFSILNSQFPPLYAFAFSGIHSFSPRLFPLMDRFPERFPIMDFYLSICHRSSIYGCIKDNLRLMDVGKIDTLSEAEKFIQTL